MQSATLQAAVRNALRLPVTEQMSVEAMRKAFSKPSSLAAPSRKIDFNNTDNITVGPDQTAIPLSSTAESISIVNTGDLTGGFGIDVYTGAVDLDTALVNDAVSYFVRRGFRRAVRRRRQSRLSTTMATRPTSRPARSTTTAAA